MAISGKPAGFFGVAVFLTAMAPATALAWIVEYGPTTALTVDVSGDVLVGGNPEFSVARLDATTGTTTWQTDLVGTAPGNDEVLALTLDAVGDVVAVGNMFNAGTGTDFAIAKLDGATGAEVWRRSLDGTHPSTSAAEQGVDVVVDAAGDVLAVGTIFDLVGDGFAVAKVDGATGAELWRTNITSASNAEAIAVDSSGDVFAVGQSEVAGDDRLFLVKLDGATGAEFWRVELDPGYEGLGNDVAVDTSGDVVVGGWVELPFTGFVWFIAIKFDGALGTELWRHQLFPIGSASAISFDATDDVIAVGGVGELFEPFGQRPNAVKLDGATGTLLWRTAIAELGTVSSLGLNAAGDVFAAGEITDENNHTDILLLRLDGATGVEEWRHVHDGTEPSTEFYTSHDRLRAVGVGASGDVASVGYRNDAAGYVSFSMKVDPDDGSAIGYEGNKLLVKDPGDPSKRSIKVVVKDDMIQAPTAGSVHDPRTAGATVRIWNPTTLEEAVFVLPAGPDWKALGTPPGAKGYRYRDKSGAGPCTKVVVKPEKKIIVACKAKTGSIPFTLDEPSQGSIGMSVRLGAEAPQCATFGGFVIRDEPGQFKAKGAPRTPACD